MRKCTLPHTPPPPTAIHGLVAVLAVAVGIAACTPLKADQRASRPADAARHEGVSQQQQPRPDHAWVIFGRDTVVAEVARTEAQRELGLMNRQEVPAGTGMLFVFDDMAERSFWMENTYVALDIAFMDASYGIVSIDQMAPLTTDSHDSRGPAMFALEVPQGWFAAHGIKAGDQATVVYGIQLKKSGP